MKNKLRVIVEFEQTDSEGKKDTTRSIAEQEVDLRTLEDLDECETKLIEVAYAAMRSGLVAQMSYVSKKKEEEKK